ncbi:DUF6164 family protein [Xanthomonas oryzae pv. oryzicola]|uniref:Transmembrane protein n=1 Tax=Xanthomonas oryzae pv. oryzicola (strain BLS256) TaxID=383407 RepID=G7TGU2_XANOB|nr:DUF6164 family protein [Xanthomonas oryzae]AEQ96686.1 hypothetical protein XOC_2568 [Xanthomonas oryzae pv. oryzicola BLS256]AJQ87780.1 membrane protein [Xanthomonas oryzae pv. oryzicola]AKK64224.1 membrane protein [Xanthomonas oryzae pv. oryzicola]AKN93245.1 membrane protein [Xanthomonas oryzae pv. oryzicola]AKN96974.1 membrane protein [Xanthomonas oryzae pv. oryzicola]
MAKLLLNLRNVPDDEADEVRALMREHGVQIYETRPSNWGISAGGLWLSDDADYPRAKAAMDAYQAQRGAIARAQRQEELAAGTAETFGALLRRRPLFVLVMLIGMLLVASLVLLPFLLLRR